MNNKQPQRKRATRLVDGILLLDKPSSITSNAALQVVKRMFGAAKAGHTGSLDPLATGMLPICFGEATKFSQYLLEADKRYRVTAKLGIKTATGDAEGESIEERAIPDFSAEQLEQILVKFRGPIAQIPSMYSALKHQGKPLYELARQGITIERPARTVTIHELIFLDRTADTLSFEISCSKGTYIRTLVEDIGEALGCGAHVIMLRRLTTAIYREQDMITLDQLEQLLSASNQAGDFSQLDARLLPIDSAVQHWPLVNISEAAAYYLLRGQPIVVPRAPSHGWVRLMLSSDRFLGVGEVLEDGRLAPRRLLDTQRI